MRQTFLPLNSTERLGVSFQLLLSHCIVSCAVLGVALLLLHNGFVSSVASLLAILIGSILGLILTLNIQAGLYRLETLLVSLAQGLPVSLVHAAWRWPLTSFFASSATLSQRISALVQNERQTAEFREQVLRQARETAALEERNRIARDLHDSIKQQIFSISISAAAAKAHAKVASEDAQEALADIQRSAKEAQVEMQALLQQLRSSPLENTSLADALSTQAQALGYRTGAHIVVKIGDLPAADFLPPGATEALFRIAQEALANIARHARAQSVSLALSQQDHSLQIEIRDDGQGFDPDKVHRGMGLANLHVRAAEMHGSVGIQSVVGQGTTICARIPLLVPLHDRQEREQRELEVRFTIEQARRNWQLVENAAPFAIALMAFSFPLVAIASVSVFFVILCVFVVLYGYLQGRLAMAKVTLYLRDNEAEMYSMRLREHSVRMQLVRISAFGCWYFWVLLHGWGSLLGWWVISVLSAVCILLFALEYKYGHDVRNRYYKILPAQELSWEIVQIERNVGRRIRLWLSAGAAFLIFYYTKLAFPPAVASGWISDMALLAIVCWVFFILMDKAQIKQWRAYLLKEKEEYESLQM